MLKVWLKPNWKEVVQNDSYDFKNTIKKINDEVKESINKFVEKYKDLVVNPDEEKYAIVEIAGGTVSDYEISDGVRLTVVDHDNLEEELPVIVDSLGYFEDPWDVAEYIYDDVVEYIKQTGNENIPEVVKIIIDRKDANDELLLEHVEENGDLSPGKILSKAI